MQKVLRINLNSRNQALKRARRQVWRKRKDEERDYEHWLQQANKKSSAYVKNERKARREDYILGPLAPDRDTGVTKGALGTMDPLLMQRKELPSHVLRGPKEAKWEKGRWVEIEKEESWEGEGNEGNIVVGDKVCVVKGPADLQGQIGLVTDVNSEKGEVVIGDVNMVSAASGRN